MSAWRDRKPEQRASPMRSITTGKWRDQPVPERRWLVPGILARGSITLLTGDGGLGKTLLMQQLMTGIALGGEHWLGLALPADPIISLGLFCEDEEDDLWRNQAAINAAYRVGMEQTANQMHIVPRVGEDNVLASFGRDDAIQPTVLYEQLDHKVRETGAQLIVVDTAADTFGGNENYRAQVRSFVNLLRRWAMASDGGVVITAHPSLYGLSSGLGTSGSTAWNNSVRARIYLTRPPKRKNADGPEPEYEEDDNERILKIMKSNYGPTGEQIRLCWEHGVFAPMLKPGAGIVDKLELDNLFVRELGNLMVDGVCVLATDRASPRNFVSLLTGRAALKRYSGADLRAAKDRMIGSGRLVRVKLGPKSRPDTLIRPADLRYPGENS